MDRRNTSPFLIIALALAGLFALGPRASQSAPTSPREVAPTTQAKPSGKATPANTEAEQLIEEFYHGSGDPLPSAISNDPHFGWEVESIVALVPDPVESALGNQFDNFLDAIQRALADSDFVLDHFKNPWPLPQPAGEGAGSDKKVTAGGVGWNGSYGTDKPLYALEPGLMLFRDAPQRKLMVLFLVGETPTRGIHKSAFKSALAQAFELTRHIRAQAADVRAQTPIVRIMGPSFSGSAASVELGIREWLSTLPESGRPDLDLVSGSATAIDRKTFLAGLDNVEFHATMIPTKDVIAKLLNWLHDPDGEHVALLSEEYTVFGREVAGTPTGSTHSSKSRTPGSANMLRLTFPLHIAELQRAIVQAQQNSKSGAPPIPLLHNSNLPLGAEGAQTRLDVFPLYSNSETNSLELLLDSVTRTITDRRIDYVVIAATDTQDTVFLAQKIRESCPNVMPIVLDGDVLFLHSSVNTYLRGMIVASTYPLYIENQFWTRPANANGNAVTEFPSDTAEGVYNATLALLGNQDLMLDYAQPFTRGSSKPPIWITVVGSDQFWPLAIFPVDTQEADYLVDSPARRPKLIPANPTFRFYPTPFLILCTIVGLGSLLIWRLCTHTSTENSRGFDYGIYRLRNLLPIFLQQSFGAAPSEESARARRAILFMFLIVLIALSATVACFFFLPLRTNPEIRSTLLPLDPLLGIRRPVEFAAVIGFFAAAIYFWSDRTSSPDAGRAQFNDLRWRNLTAISVLVLIAVLWMGLAPMDPTGRVLLFLRNTDLDSGVSPLTPLLLAYLACIVMILGSLRRRVFVETGPLDNAFLDFGTDSFSGVAELETQLRREVKVDSWNAGEWWATVAATVFAYLIIFRPWEHSVVGTPVFMLSFFVFSLAAYVGIATALLRLVLIWRATQKLLRRLYWHPSRAGYALLREGMPSQDATIDLFSPDKNLTALEVGLSKAREMLSADHALNAQVDARLDASRAVLANELVAAERSLAGALENVAAGKWDREEKDWLSTESEVNALSKTVAAVFEPLWRTVGSLADPKSAGAESDKAASIDDAGEVYVAARVVDLMRHVLPQLGTLALASTTAMLLMLFAISSYPFPTRNLMLWFSWGMVLLTVGSIMWMYFSLNRDRVLSLITGTTPGRTDWNSTLLIQLLTHALIPILVLLGAAYPAQLGRLAGWIAGLFGGSG